eukprot:342717_1
MFHSNLCLRHGNNSIPTDYFGLHFNGYNYTDSYTNNIIFAHDFGIQHKSDLCKWYGSAIGCKYNNKCLYSHSNPHSIAICKQYETHGYCVSGNQCKYRHSLPIKPIFFIDNDHIKYDSCLLYILEKDYESDCILIQLFDYTKYINYYDQPKIYNKLFSSNAILSQKQLKTYNNKYIYIIAYLFRQITANSIIWPDYLSHFMIRNHFTNYKQTNISISNDTNDTNGSDNNNNICTVIHLEPQHIYYISMRTTDKNGYLLSEYADYQSFKTKTFKLTEVIITIYCKAFESFINMTQQSSNRLKLWNIIVHKKSEEVEIDILIQEMICSWLCLFNKKLNKNRTGINIPTTCYNQIAKHVTSQVKQLLLSCEETNQGRVMTKMYFEKHISELLKKLCMRQILIDAFKF